MAERTLTQLILKAKQRSNMEYSDFVTESEWTDYINYSISELRDLLISKVGESYFEKALSFSIPSNDTTYTLPADFYKLTSLSLVTTDCELPLNRFEREDEIYLDERKSVLKYRIRGNEIVFTPPDLARGKSFKGWYVPLITELAAPGDKLEGYNGWDEFVILRSAVMALEKEEQDTSSLTLRLEQLRQRIEAMADNRDQYQPARIYDNEKLVYPYHNF